MADDSTHDINPNPAPPSRRRRIAKYGCIVLVVMAAVILSGIVSFRLFVKSRYTPEQWQELKQVGSTVLELPADWHRPATLPPPEVVEFANTFYPQVDALSTSHTELLYGDYSPEQQLLDRMRKGDTLTPTEETSFSVFMADLQPLIEYSSATVSMPGYSLETDLYGASAGPSLLRLQIFTKFASIAGLEQLKNGNDSLAVETAALPLRLIRRPPQSYYSTHLVSIAVASITAHTLHSIADKTTDTAALTRGIALLEELKPVVFPAEIEHWRYSDVLGLLRWAAAYGYPVSLEPQPYVDFYTQTVPFHSGHYYRWITEKLPPDDPRVATAQARLHYLQQPPVDWEKVFEDFGSDKGDPLAEISEAESKPAVELDYSETTSIPRLQMGLSKLILGVHPYATLINMGNERYKEMEIRALVASALYDLTQIHFARRLAELQGNTPTEPEAFLQQIPGLQTKPRDPFTSRPYLFNTELDTVYSVGPDKQNDGTRIIYDSTNGTVSGGDVWLNRR